MAHRGTGRIVFMGSKTIFIPSTLIHSLGATLASGAMGVSCHWCYSPVNQTDTGSYGLHVEEREPPAKRHMGEVSTCLYWQQNHQQHHQCLNSTEAASSSVDQLMLTFHSFVHVPIVRSIHLFVISNADRLTAAQIQTSGATAASHTVRLGLSIKTLVEISCFL